MANSPRSSSPILTSAGGAAPPWRRGLERNLEANRRISQRPLDVLDQIQRPLGGIGQGRVVQRRQQVPRRREAVRTARINAAARRACRQDERQPEDARERNARTNATVIVITSPVEPQRAGDRAEGDGGEDRRREVHVPPEPALGDDLLRAV